MEIGLGLLSTCCSVSWISLSSIGKNFRVVIAHPRVPNFVRPAISSTYIKV